MGYLSAHGHDWSDKYNYDGLGISYLVFAVVYSIIFYTMCGIVWYYRKHPIIRMRNIGLALSSLLILHVYLFLIFLAYPLNGHYPCNFEFWIMSIYLPIGIGLFQAQNQQLLMVSRGQNKLIVTDELYKPLAPKGRGVETWTFRLKQWWQGFSEQGKYEGFVAVGIIVQVNISESGVRHSTNPGHSWFCLRSYSASLASSLTLASWAPTGTKVNAAKAGNGKSQ